MAMKLFLGVLATLACVASVCLAETAFSCEHAEKQLDSLHVGAVDKFLEQFMAGRNEMINKTKITRAKIMKDATKLKHTDGKYAFWAVYQAATFLDAKKDPTFKIVFSKVVNDKGKRILKREHVEELVDKILVKPCAEYTSALVEPLKHASIDDSCTERIKWRVQLCKILNRHEHKLIREFYEKAKVVIVDKDVIPASMLGVPESIDDI